MEAKGAKDAGTALAIDWSSICCVWSYHAVVMVKMSFEECPVSLATMAGER
jgi:hypothetical protein